VRASAGFLLRALHQKGRPTRIGGRQKLFRSAERLKKNKVRDVTKGRDRSTVEDQFGVGEISQGGHRLCWNVLFTPGKGEHEGEKSSWLSVLEEFRAQSSKVPGNETTSEGSIFRKRLALGCLGYRFKKDKLGQALNWTLVRAVVQKRGVEGFVFLKIWSFVGGLTGKSLRRGLMSNTGDKGELGGAGSRRGPY